MSERLDVRGSHMDITLEIQVDPFTICIASYRQMALQGSLERITNYCQHPILCRVASDGPQLGVLIGQFLAAGIGHSCPDVRLRLLYS